MGMYDCIGIEPKRRRPPDPPTANQIHDREVHGYGEDRKLYIRVDDERLGYNPHLCRTNVQQDVRYYVSLRARELAKAMIDFMVDSEERSAAIEHIGDAMASFQKALDAGGCCDYCWLKR